MGDRAKLLDAARRMAAVGADVGRWNDGGEGGAGGRGGTDDGDDPLGGFPSE